MKYIDISPILSERTAIFPGDVNFERDVSLDFKKGSHLTLSSIKTTLHIGAHADAPNHYHAQGAGIDQISLEPYLGSVQVIEVSQKTGRISVEEIRGKRIEAPRILFKTNSFPDPDRWNSDFRSLSPELLRYLSDNGVILVGIDTPSVDPEASKALESHQILFEKNISVLEGLILSDVLEGIYTLVALPLKIKGADASPVRAILVSEF